MSIQGFGPITGATYTPSFRSNIHTLADPPHSSRGGTDSSSTTQTDAANRALNGLLEVRNEQSEVIRETPSQLGVIARDMADRIKKSDELLREHEEKKKAAQADFRKIEESNRRFESQRPQLIAQVNKSDEALRSLKAEAERVNGNFSGVLSRITTPIVSGFEWVKKKLMN